MQHSDNTNKKDKSIIKTPGPITKIWTALNDVMINIKWERNRDISNLECFQFKAKSKEEAADVIQQIKGLFPHNFNFNLDESTHTITIPNHTIAELVNSKVEWPSKYQWGYAGDARIHNLTQEIMNSEKLNYKISKNGVCSAYANMGKNAFLVRDVETFSERWKWIDSGKWPSCSVVKIDPIGANDKIEDHLPNMKINDLIIVRFSNEFYLVDDAGKVCKSIKVSEYGEKAFDDAIHPTHIQKPLLESDIAKIDDEAQVKDTISILIKSRELAKTIESRGLLNDNKRAELLSFLDGIKSYQEPHEIAELFGQRTPTDNEVDQLVRPKKLEASPPFEADSFTGAYDTNHLYDLISSLNNSLTMNTQITQPVVLMIKNINHEMCLGYDPKNAPLVWTLFNVNNNKVLHFSSNNEELWKLTGSVMKGFFQDMRNNTKSSIAIMSTTIHGLENEKHELMGCIQKWKNSNTYSRLHEVTENKAKYEDSYYATWLEVAIKYGDIDTAKALLKLGAEVNTTDTYYNLTPLHFAATNKDNIDIVSLLLKLGANPYAKNDQGKTVKDIAMDAGNFEIANEIQSKMDDFNDFMKSIEASDIKTTRFYLEHGYIHPRLADDYKNGHIFLFSVNKENIDIVALLLNNNINPNVRDSNGNTPLHIATLKNNIELLGLLLKNDIVQRQLNLVNSEGLSPIYLAMKNECIPAIKLISSNKYFDVNSINKEIETMLHLAVKNKDVIVLKQLLDFPKIQINMRNSEGSTPLHLAIKQHQDLQGDNKTINLILIENLLRKGAKFNKQDNEGNTAWMMSQNHPDILRIYSDLHLIKFSNSTAKIDSSLHIPLHIDEAPQIPISSPISKPPNNDTEIHNRNLEEAKTEVELLVQAIPIEFLPRSEARTILGIINKNDAPIETRINDSLQKLIDLKVFQSGDTSSFHDDLMTAKEACDKVGIKMPAAIDALCTAPKFRS